jgi:hypothetical protein
MRGRTGVRAVLAAIVLVVMIGALEAEAHAAPAPIAEVAAATPLSGGEGWLVWSAPVPGGYALMGYHDGRVAQLPVAVRQQPFDAGIGTDGAGAPVVVFSRCAEVPGMASTGGQTLGGEIVEPLTGRGCRIHLLPLGGGYERALPIPAGPGVSDTTPAIWRGTVTFGRRAPSHGRVMQVLSWTPRAPRKLLTLPHGAVPPCPSSRRGCTEPPVQASVGALASDGSIVAFVWNVWGGRTGPEGDEEVRVDRPDGHGAAIAAGNVGGEACMGASAGQHRLEKIAFEPPFVSGSTASFGELYTFGCFTGFAGLLVTHGARPGYASRGKLSGVTLAVAGNGGQLFGLLAPRSEATLDPPGPSWTDTDGPFCNSGSPCAIEPLSTPPLERDRRLPFEPVSFYGSID